MALDIVKVTPATVRVRITTANPDERREWTVDRAKPGPLGAMQAVGHNGTRCTIGMFRTRDGAAMQPDYARLRRLVTG